ncbi:unnamed protein product, partial [marine sediment metagenome]
PTKQQNVYVLMDATKNSVPPAIREYQWSLLSALPAGQFVGGIVGGAFAAGQAKGRTPRQPGIMGQAQQAGALVNALFGEDSAEGDPIRNYREEAALAFHQYLQSHPLETPEDERMYAVFIWKTIEGKKNEIAGREGHLGGVGAVFDIPKNVTTYYANEALAKGIGSGVFAQGSDFMTGLGKVLPLEEDIMPYLSAPNDKMNWGHASLGMNIAYGLGERANSGL